MKLLRKVVYINSKGNLHKEENFHFDGAHTKNPRGNPEQQNNLHSENGVHKNSYFFSRVLDHFKKYIIYYILCFIVFSAFALVMQCSDVSNEKKKKYTKKDRSKIKNYRRDIES
ncbi:hypothetical protein PMALA_009850 [Plasmodium malariae]|uniref:Fam-m protein n=2 Tax=Plasmodium (Plasmodium) TaxID=418103 RepID=A0A1A8VV91_PLAMA|nr:hypothetical protein PMALA_009850 [Plasmodium malariae]